MRRTGLALSCCLVLASGARAATDPLTDPQVAGDAFATAIVAHVQGARPGAVIVVDGKRKQVDAVTGHAYTALKLRVDGVDTVAIANQDSGVVALDGELPAREAAALIASLPPVFRKMSDALLAHVREQLGWRVASQGSDLEVDVSLSVASANDLERVRVEAGSAVVEVFDSELTYLLGLSQGVPAPPVRSVRIVAPWYDVLALAALPEVIHVDRTTMATPRLDVSVPHVRGDVVRGFGLRGSGYEIGIVDTGVDDKHPNLARQFAPGNFSTVTTDRCDDGTRIDDECCPSGACVMDVCVGGIRPGAQCCPGTPAGTCEEPTDDTSSSSPPPPNPRQPIGHGTHVAGIAANDDGAFTGMASSATVISAKFFPGTTDEAHAALMHARTNGADVINGSYGYSAAAGDGRSNGSRDVDREVFAYNRTVVIAAEELPYKGRCAAHPATPCTRHSQCPAGDRCTAVASAPNDTYNGITVGMSLLTVPPTVSQISEIGPTADGRSKPDLIAPGGVADAVCAAPAPGIFCLANEDCQRVECPGGFCSAVNAQCVGGQAPGAACCPGGVCDPATLTCIGGGSAGNACALLARCVPSGDEIDSTSNTWEGPKSDFRDLRGTSMSAPHVSGLALLLFQFGDTVAPSVPSILPDTPYIKAAILNSATRLAGWSHTPFQPLDVAQGAGELNAEAAYRTYTDDLRVWQQRVTGTAVGDSHWYYLDLHETPAPTPGTPTPIVLTLVFERHETEPARPPAAFTPPNDLDLKLYDSTGALVDRSLSLHDTVEHIVYAAPANGRYCIEVDPLTLTQGGSELYALAASHRIVFNGKVNPCVPDFGDAPDGPYRTRLDREGPRHLDWTKEWLGTSRPEIDGEIRKPDGAVVSRVDPYPSVSGEKDAEDPADQDGKPNLVNADGWDDGVELPVILIPGVANQIAVTAQASINRTGFGDTGRYEESNDGKRLYLNAWADWNGDGDFAIPAEKIIGRSSPTSQFPIDPENFGPDGRYTIGEPYDDANGSGAWEPGETFTDQAGVAEKRFAIEVVPPPHSVPWVWLRFRLDYGEDVANVDSVSPTLFEDLGEAQFGEVEDYLRCVLVTRRLFHVNNGWQLAAGVTVAVIDPLGILRVGRNTVWAAGAWAAARRLQASNGSRLWGVAADLIRLGRDVVVQGATLPMPVSLGLYPFPDLSGLVPGSTDVTVGASQSLTLPPGSYGTVRVGEGATLVLGPGEYFLRELNVGRNARVVVQAGGQTTINLTQKLRIGAGSALLPNTGAPTPIVRSNGDRVKLGPGSRVQAGIIAPRARATFGRGMEFAGGILADRATSDHSVTATCPVE